VLYSNQFPYGRFAKVRDKLDKKDNFNDGMGLVDG